MLILFPGCSEVHWLELLVIKISRRTARSTMKNVYDSWFTKLLCNVNKGDAKKFNSLEHRVESYHAVATEEIVVLYIFNYDWYRVLESRQTRV